MNMVIIYGKIITRIDYKFIYDRYCKKNNNDMYLGKYNHVSITKFRLNLLNRSIIEAYAYNKMADYIYSRLKENDIICIVGKLDSNGMIEVSGVHKIV